MSVVLAPEQLAALRAMLATIDAGSAQDQSAVATALSDNRRDETDDGTAKGIAMCRIDGPFKNHSTYRLRVVDRETRRTTCHTYPTKDEAKAAIAALRSRYRRPEGVPVSTALEAYGGYLATERQNRPGTIETTLGRVRSLFRNPAANTEDLTRGELLRGWQTLKTTPVSKAGKLPSTDTLVGVSVWFL